MRLSTNPGLKKTLEPQEEHCIFSYTNSQAGVQIPLGQFIPHVNMKVSSQKTREIVGGQFIYVLTSFEIDKYQRHPFILDAKNVLYLIIKPLYMC